MYWTSYVGKRLVTGAITLLLVTVAVFGMLRLVPGDPARLLAGPTATPSDVAALHKQLGLSRPLPVQYAIWLKHTLAGELGTSIASGESVASLVVPAYFNSLELAAAGMVLAIIVGVPLGILAASSGSRIVGSPIALFSLAGISVPIFYTGLLLIIVFAVHVHWLPAAGKDGVSSFVLPSTTLAIYEAAYITRITRAAMLEVLGKPFVIAAKSKGLSRTRVITHHALRNAAIPVATIAIVQFGYLLGGAALTETVFGWPGLGRLLVTSITNRDYPVVQAGVLLIAVSILILYLLADLFYARLDPRVRV